MIIRPDKGNGVVIMDRVIYNQQMYALLNDKNKFKKLSEDSTKLREGQLQRYLRELNKKQFLDDATYERIYPSGSQPSRLYGTPKVHKIKSNSEVPSFRSIVSSIGSFNFSLHLIFFQRFQTEKPIYLNLTGQSSIMKNSF